MPTLDDALNQLAQQIQLIATPDPVRKRQFSAMLTLPGSLQPGVHPGAREVGDGGVFPPRHNPLSVSGTTEVRKIVQEPINLQWVSENVLFQPISTPPSADDLDDPPTVVDQLPVQPSIPVPGTPVPAGVPGTIGLLTGTVPVFEILDELVNVNATIEARWRVLDENKVPVASFGWSSQNVSGTGSEFVPSPDHILNTAVELTMIPPFTDYVSLSAPLTVRRWIEAHFRLTAAGVSTPWIDLVFPVDLPPIPIPTVLLMFFNPDFNGPALLVLPENSPFAKDSIMGALATARDELTEIRALVEFVGNFIDLVNSLEPVWDELSIAPTRADEISSLNDIDVVGTEWWQVFTNDREAEDELASLMFFGAPGRTLEAYNDRNFSDSQGQLNVTIGPELAVWIRTLYHSETDEFVPPDAAPAGRVVVARKPQGCRGFWCFAGGGRKITAFGDEFSSLRLRW
ncbi:MAG: hypothetical protein QOC82_3005 [Frankiaceae bacterium]|nr:hypothetical protein [Frankiaceae bacterium]